MQNILTPKQPMHNILWPTQKQATRNALLVLLGAFVLALASQLVVPLYPVPLTFQSATVILLGLGLGSRRGTMAVITYLIAGFAGAPVFAEFSGGLHMLLNPSTGYLFGFIPAVWLAGYLAERGFARSFVGSLAAALLGAFCIFAVGVAWLAAFAGWSFAWQVGVMPFVVTEPLKLIVAAILAKQLWRTRAN